MFTWTKQLLTHVKQFLCIHWNVEHRRELRPNPHTGEMMLFVVQICTDCKKEVGSDPFFDRNSKISCKLH